jgi:uncharacterized paraquat-inducible protein A
MKSGLQHRCLHHAEREAVARCPECRQFFCRECVTEHEDRILCAACLRKLTRRRSDSRVRFGVIVRAFNLVLGLIVAWLCFHVVGQVLLRAPSSFHEGTMWRSGLLQ